MGDDKDRFAIKVALNDYIHKYVTASVTRVSDPNLRLLPALRCGVNVPRSTSEDATTAKLGGGGTEAPLLRH